MRVDGPSRASSLSLKTASFDTVPFGRDWERSCGFCNEIEGVLCESAGSRTGCSTGNVGWADSRLLEPDMVTMAVAEMVERKRAMTLAGLATFSRLAE